MMIVSAKNIFLIILFDKKVWRGQWSKFQERKTAWCGVEAVRKHVFGE